MMQPSDKYWSAWDTNFIILVVPRLLELHPTVRGSRSQLLVTETQETQARTAPSTIIVENSHLIIKHLIICQGSSQSC